MPKAILEFNLPQEKEEFQMAQKAIEYYNVLFEIENEIGESLKYTNLSSTQENLLIFWKKKINQVLDV